MFFDLEGEFSCQKLTKEHLKAKNLEMYLDFVILIELVTDSDQTISPFFKRI